MRKAKVFIETVVLVLVIGIVILVFAVNLNHQKPEELEETFLADWIYTGTLYTYNQEVKKYGVKFGIDFSVESSDELVVIQEVLFVEEPVKDAEKNVWYIDAGANLEYAFDNFSDVCFKGVFTGEYGLSLIHI